LAEKNNTHWSFISKKASFEEAFFVFPVRYPQKKTGRFCLFCKAAGEKLFYIFLDFSRSGGVLYLVCERYAGQVKISNLKKGKGL
jgi:hypothetical protein